MMPKSCLQRLLTCPASTTQLVVQEKLATVADVNKKLWKNSEIVKRMEAINKNK